MNKIYSYLKKLSETPVEEREIFLESMKMRSYSSPEISETDMWILSTAVENADYLTSKLKEAEELSLDLEAPSEMETDELSLDLEAPSEMETDELSLDVPAEGGEELSLDLEEPSEMDAEELSLNTPVEGGEETDQPIETSKAGIGILPLLGEIQDKLANGKPSEIELAAIKALVKLIK